MKNKMKTLNLVLKHKWYDMIDRGEKPEEYREIKPYWTKRLTDYNNIHKWFEDIYKRKFNVSIPHRYTHVCFHKGYTSTTMTFEINRIVIGTGNPEWGAPDKPVFIIKLGQRV